MDWKIGAVVIGGIALAACSEDGNGAPNPVEAGPGEDPNDEERLTHRNDGPGCVPVPLDFDEPFYRESPAEAFAPWAGACTAPFSWDGGGSGAVVVPETGETRVTVSVELDPSRATVIQPRPGSAGTCPATIEVPAKLDLRTEDGRFAEQRQVALRYDALGGGLWQAGFTIEASEAGGSLSVSAAEGETVTLAYSIGPLGEGCSGEIRMTVSRPTDAGAGHRGAAGSASARPFATWSASEMDAGQQDAAQDAGQQEAGMDAGAQDARAQDARLD